MKITLIVAHDNNRAIGKNGKLPWHLPNDLQWFKKQTVNKIVVMGRTTWEGLKLKPLPWRINIVMTNQKNYKANGAVVCHSLPEVLSIAMAKQVNNLMITGGAQIYELFYPLADELMITKVDTEIKNADTFFLDYNPNHWFEHFEEPHPSDDSHAFEYTFKIFKRIVKK